MDWKFFLLGVYWNQTGEHKQTDRQTDRQTDATKHTISPASRSLMTVSLTAYRLTTRKSTVVVVHDAGPANPGN